MLERQLTISRRDLFHLTKRKTNVMKRNNAIKNLEKQYTFSVPSNAQQSSSNTNRHKTSSTLIQFPIKKGQEKDAPKAVVDTQTTQVPTEACVDRVHKASCFKNNNDEGITDKTENDKSERNSSNHPINPSKEYKKSITSFNPIPIMKTSSFSVNTNNSNPNNTPSHLKLFNKMNTRVSGTNNMIKSYQSRPTITSNNNKQRSSRQIPNVNPLEVQEEDKIFNLLNQEDFEKSTDKPTRLSLQDKGPFDPNRRVLDKLYHFSPNYIEDIERAKRKKRVLPLERYQNHLLEVIGENISREYKQKLERKFYRLRVECWQTKPRKDIISLEEIEEKEKEIINHTNAWDKECERMLKTAGSGFRRTKFVLPEIKFESVLIAKDDEEKRDILYSH